MAADRSQGRNGAARSGDHEESGGTALSVRESPARVPDVVGGPAARHHSRGESAGQNLPVGLPSERKAGEELPGGVGGGMRGGGLSDDARPRLPTDRRPEPR